MKANLVMILAIFFVVFSLLGCGKGERYHTAPLVLEPIVAEYYESIGVTEDVRVAALAEYQTMFDDAQWEGVTLRLPDYSSNVYELTGMEQLYDGQTIKQIYLAEKYNATTTDYQGYLFAIWLVPRAYYAEAEWLLETPFPSKILGCDTNYLYMVQYPSDVQYDWEDELATSLYQAAFEAKNKILEDFVEVNELTVIP